VPGVEAWLPHRPPFLFVDELVAVDARGGHFALHLAPDDPRLTDGAFEPLRLLEALAQSAAACHGHTLGAAAQGFLGEVSATFGGVARGGDTVSLVVELERRLGAFARFRGRASVGERLLVEAQLTVAELSVEAP
jgi:3-hydroxymyristoyl/3-hydroxydecanoyl-(acyl carrier protein) dehydratase